MSKADAVKTIVFTAAMILYTAVTLMLELVLPFGLSAVAFVGINVVILRWCNATAA